MAFQETSTQDTDSSAVSRMSETLSPSMPMKNCTSDADGAPRAWVADAVRWAVNDPAGAALPIMTGYADRTFTYTWNGTGQLLTAQLPRTDVTAKTTYTYTGGTLTSVKNAANQTTTINTYKSGGWPLTVTDPNSDPVGPAFTSNLSSVASSRSAISRASSFDFASCLARSASRRCSSRTSPGVAGSAMPRGSR